MSNKTINGINVSEWELKGVLIPITECKYFDGIGDCKETKGLCVDNDNCYFKQLKRLRKENEELKELKCKFKEYCTCDTERLRKENEELKARFNELYNNAEQLANKYNRYSGNKENELVEIINKTTDEKNKYKQALEEIKSYCNDYAKTESFLEIVFDKINEVLK